MSADSSPAIPVNVDDVWANLTEDRYVLLNDKMIGLPTNFRKNFLDKYFNDHTLRHDEGDWPVDRKRARDVVGYEWRDGRLYLREHDTITITDRADIPGKREHARVWLLEDPEAENLVRTFLSLVPPHRRQREGTFGINLFRTFTNVVTKPHRDDEEFVIIYVLDRIGDGAETFLYDAEGDFADGWPTAEPTLRHQLNPGEFLIIDDERLVHDASALEPCLDGRAQRDVLVCTVDYRSTYFTEAMPLHQEGVLAGSGGR